MKQLNKKRFIISITVLSLINFIFLQPALADRHYNSRIYNQPLAIRNITAKKNNENNTQKNDPNSIDGFIPTQPFVDILAIGLAEGTLFSLSREGNTDISEEQGFTDGLDSEGRVAFYLRGKVLGKYGITASYDSTDPFRERLFENLAPDRFYPIYGDGSNYYREGQTKNRLYLKVDIDKSYLMYGDFSTGFSGTEFTSYSRTFPGIKAHYENSDLSLTLTGAKTAQTQKRDQIPGNGLSGIFYLTQREILEGSERIWIETRDRDIPELVINSEVKIRNKDYTIDYERGTILFKEPIPTIDEYENPIYIMAQYECNGTDEVTSLGFRGDIQLNPDLTAGVTYINENSNQALQIYGIHSNFKINDKVNIYGEYALSRSLYGTDNAGKIEFTTNLSPQFGINGFYRKVGSNFFNPSGSVIDRGTTQYGIEAKALLAKENLINIAYVRGENELLQTTSQRAQLNYKKNFGPVQVNAGYVFLDFTSPDLTVNSHVTNFGVKTSLNSNLSIFAKEEIEWLKENSKPDRLTNSTTSLGAEYLFENGTIGYLQEDFLRGDQCNGDNTILGFKSPIGLGENTQFYAQYALGGAISSEKNQASIGLNTRINITEGLTARLNYQRFMGNRKLDPAESICGALEFLGNDNFKATIRYEIRNQEDNRENLISLYGDGKISEDLSLIGRYTYSGLENFSSGNFTRLDSHLTFGLAYRPVWNNKFNIIARYDMRRYRDSSGGEVGMIDTLTYLGSLEGVYGITDNLELSGKYAYKQDQDKFSGSIDSIDLFQGRMTYRFNPRLSIFTEARYMRHLDTGERTLASIVAIDYLLWENWMLEGGYVFRKFEELNIDNENVQSQGPLLKLVLKY